MIQMDEKLLASIKLVMEKQAGISIQVSSDAEGGISYLISKWGMTKTFDSSKVFENWTNEVFGQIQDEWTAHE